MWKNELLKNDFLCEEIELMSVQLFKTPSVLAINQSDDMSIG
jgi:hypothetical protein